MDLVAVPDFRPASRAAFEARALFLLASWWEHAAGGRGSLHLACIGEPPRSVAALAERAGAEISVHAPLEVGQARCANKLRGFEVPSKTGGRRRLLVDADVLILSDPVLALGAVPPEHLAAAPATVPRVPPELWEEVYGAVGLRLPAERMVSVSGALGFPPEAQGFPPDPMPPYFNGGVLLVPDGCPLRARWEDHLARIPARFADRAAGWPEPKRRAIVQSDQAALATALASLRAEGWGFSLLPDAAHARRVHFRGGAMRVADPVVLHAIGMFKGLRETGAAAVEAALELWLAGWQRGIREGAGGNPWRAWREGRRAAVLLRGLYRRHVRSVLGA